MEVITAKPHHILDIFKLYGAGIKEFVPDPAYGHDFYRIGNLVLGQPDAMLRFTAESNDICAPCRYRTSGRCSGEVPTNPEEFRSKEDWNRTIDGRLMNLLGIEVGDRMTALDYAQLVCTTLTPESIATVWSERPVDETQRRTELLLAGMEEYIQTNRHDAQACGLL
jgi:hypothetical protein